VILIWSSGHWVIWSLPRRENYYVGIGDSVWYSSRPDLVAAALRQRASAPDFGVTREYFGLWAGVLMERDNPESVRLGRRNAPRDPSAYAAPARLERMELLETLRQLNVSRSGAAAEMTATTIRSIEREMAR
jgi:hypothetical protein